MEAKEVNGNIGYTKTDVEYSLEALEESLLVESSIVGTWRDVVTNINRTCRYCNKEFKLADVLKAEKLLDARCVYHPGPFFSVHESVSWEGGGDSWDRRAWLCCRSDDPAAPGCVTGTHAERNLQLSFDNTNFDALLDSEHPRVGRSDSCKPDREHVSPYTVEVCGSCNTAPCTCDDVLLFDFDEHDIPKKR
jgi:hypothetical protein